ncbi:EAL domain-containing protein [Alkalihalobacterium alkalinitrilicum]|uniref:EAL domain-containing protein n=1 Tax=Alkalihalobacterium alkalinitrilicum TaxID=427920 RepID=UPI0009952FFB|nr:GGDEF domain-containing phosphodiesterase [Alkalihalobacterium alkalinitrilicum]
MGSSHPDPQMNRLSNAINEDLLLGTEKIGQLRSFSSRISLEETLTEQEKNELLLMIGGIQLFIDDFEMKTYYLSHYNREQNILYEKQQFINETVMFLELLKSDDFLLKDTEVIFNQATAAINRGFLLYEKGNLILLDHLNEMQKSYQIKQIILFLIIIFSILLIYLFFGGVYVSVMQTIQALQTGTSQWIKGDLRSRIQVKTKDELKYVGDSFNQLAGNFEKNLEENRRIQLDLQHSLKKNNQLATAINNLEIGVIITDPILPDNPITFVNAGFEKLTGYRAEEVIGRKPSRLQGEKTSTKAKKRIREGIKNRESFSIEILNYRKDGELFWNLLSITPVYEDGKLVNFLGIQTDITKQKKADEKIYSLAYADQLTHLPNHNRLQMIVKKNIKSLMQEATILRLDVARFKNINHVRGFTLGDFTLVELAKRLEHILTGKGGFSRQYGDKFTIYLPHISNKQEVEQILKEIHKQLHEPFKIDGYTFYLEVSIGVSQFPKDGTDFITLMQHAEAALFKAKGTDGHFYVYYQSEMHKNFHEEYSIENNLRVAIEKEELFWTYQPKQDLKTGIITGMEALIRWNHPELGVISPFKFIPIAEKTGLIYQIGEWVLLEACKQNKKFQEQGLQPLIVSVNISAKQFSNKEYLLTTIDRIIEQTKLDPKYLEIELTESVFQNPAIVEPVLAEIKKRQIQVSVDDFGTGYSSLSYLKLFPIDVLKIDRAFIKDLLENNNDQKLTKSMIEIGHGLSLKVIAEGVETSRHIELLKTMNCDEVQGYYLAKQLTADEFVEFMRMNN